MALYEVEATNEHGGTDYFCGEFETLDNAAKSFEMDLAEHGYKIEKIWQIIGRGNFESALDL